MAGGADSDHMLSVVSLVYGPFSDVMKMRPRGGTTGISTLPTSFCTEVFLHRVANVGTIASHASALSLPNGVRRFTESCGAQHE